MKFFAFKRVTIHRMKYYIIPIDPSTELSKVPFTRFRWLNGFVSVGIEEDSVSMIKFISVTKIIIHLRVVHKCMLQKNGWKIACQFLNVFLFKEVYCWRVNLMSVEMSLNSWNEGSAFLLNDTLLFLMFSFIRYNMTLYPTYLIVKL